MNTIHNVLIFSITISSALIVLSGCQTPQNLLKNGKYQASVKECHKKLLKKRQKEKHILTLEKAYPLFTNSGNNEIDNLSNDRSPDAVKEVIDKLKKMDLQQSKIQALLPLYAEGRTINFPVVDYKSRIAKLSEDAKDKWYDLALSLMKQGTKRSFRKAAAELKKVETMDKYYKDVNSLLSKANTEGKHQAKINFKNASDWTLNNSQTQKLNKMKLNFSNSNWLELSKVAIKKEEENFNINIIFQEASISDESIKKINTTTVIDTLVTEQYLKDKNGNVVKDSLGNDVTTKVFEKIKCDVTEYTQSKGAEVVAVIGISDYKSNKIIMDSYAVKAYHTFEHNYYELDGNEKALEGNTTYRNAKNVKKKEFPSKSELIKQALTNLKPKIEEKLASEFESLIE